jgi:hypothetical protein
MSLLWWYPPESMGVGEPLESKPSEPMEVEAPIAEGVPVTEVGRGVA